MRENRPEQRAQVEQGVPHTPPNLSHVGPGFSRSFPPVFAGFGAVEQLHAGLGSGGIAQAWTVGVNVDVVGVGRWSRGKWLVMTACILDAQGRELEFI